MSAADYMGETMAGYKSQSTTHGELMSALVKEREKFSTEDEFMEFAVDEVRKFISDLRTINIEVSMRANLGKRQQQA